MAGAKGIGDYSVYPERAALRWNRRTTLAVPETDHVLEIGVRREVAPDPRDNLNLYSQTDNTFPNLGSEDFVLAQREVTGVRTDFLALLYPDWPDADNLPFPRPPRTSAGGTARAGPCPRAAARGGTS